MDYFLETLLFSDFFDEDFLIGNEKLFYLKK